MGRISAVEIESAVLAALKGPEQQKDADNTSALHMEVLKSVVVCSDRLLIATAGPRDGDDRKISVAWTAKPRHLATITNGSDGLEATHNDSLVQSISRAHAWLRCLRDGAYTTVEELAEANQIHPKVVRQALRLAFLSPSVTSVILQGTQPVGLVFARIPKLLPLPWAEHQRLLD